MAEKHMRVVFGARVDEFEKAMKGVQKNMKSVSKQMISVGKGMTTAITLPLAAVGGAALKVFGDFEQSMVNSTAIMGNLSEEMRKDLEGVARDVAKTTKFSATEAADAYFYLASAGLDAAQSMEAMPKMAAFAQAGNFDLARATDLLTDAQSALGLSVDDTAQNMLNMTKVSDVLVKANTLANATVEQFSESLTNKAVAAARLLNKDVEEATAVLAVFADQGNKGAAAGESLNIVWRDLQKAAIKNADEFEKLNITVFDAQGNMRNTADIVQDLEGAFDGLSDEQKRATLMTLGFTDESVSNIQALLGTSDAIREYEKELRNASGVTGEIAENQMQSLWAQLGLVKDRLVDAGIELGSVLAPIIKDVVIPLVDSFIGFVSRLVEWFSNLSPTTQQVIIVILGLVAAIGPLLVVAGTLIGAVGNMVPLFTFLGGTVLPAFGIGVGATVAPIVLVIKAIATAIAIGVLLWRNWDTIKEKASELWGNIKNTFNNIKEAIMTPIRAAADFIKEQIDRVKGFFSGLKLELPKIKLPTFKLDGKFSLAPPSVPKISIQWNAAGAVMDKAMIFGGAGNTLFGGGEAGKEGIVPLEGRHMYPLADAIADRLSKNKQSIRHEHSGVLTVRGVNNRDELMGVVDIVMDRIRQEVRG